jgi:hypothetical protein
MKIDLFNSASEILGNAGLELVRLYTGSALQLNAYDVTACGYAARADDFFLSTTQNIPIALKLPLEIDNGKNRLELVDHYRTEAIKRSCEDYLVRCVSVIDASFEEVYEMSLEKLSPQLNAKQQQHKVKSSWAFNVNGRTDIATYFVDTLGLIAPPGKQSTIDMVFDRYCEIREVRHALVHNRGVLSERHQIRLNQLRSRLPENLRHGSIASAEFLADGVVVMSMHEMLALRQWFYTVILGFLREAFSYGMEHAAHEY